LQEVQGWRDESKIGYGLGPSVTAAGVGTTVVCLTRERILGQVYRRSAENSPAMVLSSLGVAPLSSHSSQAPCWWLYASWRSALLPRWNAVSMVTYSPRCRRSPKPTPSLDSQNRSRWRARSAISARKRSRASGGKWASVAVWNTQRAASAGAATTACGRTVRASPANRVGGSRCAKASTCCNRAARSGCSGQTRARSQRIACGSLAWMGCRSMPTRVVTRGSPAWIGGSIAPCSAQVNRTGARSSPANRPAP